MLRFLTAGESHGQSLACIIEGIPAGLGLDERDIDGQLERRQVGYGRGGRMKIEADQVQILSGVRFGKTIGSPIALLIANRDWTNWERVMSPTGQPADDLEEIHLPRPGHADLAGGIKYGFRDLRNVLERASARETAARVATGAVARKLLAEFGIEVLSHVIQIGRVEANLGEMSFQEIGQRAEQSSLRCADQEAEGLMKEEIDQARKAGDSVGGKFEVIALNPPIGLGSYTQWDRRLDGRLAQAMMSIPAIKGVEIGLGFAGASLRGSQVHDEILPAQGNKFQRPTNRAGGIEGGVSNGEPIVVRGAMKPIPTLTQPLRSVDLETGQPAQAHAERSDVCAVPAAGIVGEAMVAIELAKAMLEKFGGDNLEDMRSNFESYLERIGGNSHL